MPSVLILGGAGFIGTRLASLFSEQSSPFRIGDLRRSGAFPNQSIECDVRNHKTLADAAAGADVIVNLAAEHRDDVWPLSRYYDTNVRGAAEVCIAARLAGIKKLIFTSSVAVYGFRPVPADESGPFEPFNEYGRTKLQAESVYRAWATEDPSRTLVIVRPTVVFGETNRGNVYNLMRQIAANRFMMVGDGSNVKSMSYVGNVAAFLMHTLSFGPGTYTFNYSDKPDMTTSDLVNQIRRSLRLDGPVRHVPISLARGAGHVFDLVARVSGRTFPVSAIRITKFTENTQVRADLVKQTGFVPPYTLAEGLSRTVEAEFSTSQCA